ncbi:MAG: hypothetical protein DLM68_09360 [Hyphomicrobiales bacterium]|nr:MAG: hypothetical protein DLM68_09360 [Hyphomicrobiales bacterium]
MEKRAPPGDTQRHFEPKTIQPGRPDQGSARGEGRVWIWVGSYGGRRVHFARPGLFSVIIGLLLLVILTAILVAIVLSVLLIGIPVLALIVAVILWRVLRGR